MKTETREIYRCDHCRKVYFRKHAAAYHESVCSKNPALKRACHGCANLGKAEALVYSGRDEYFSGEPICRHKDFLFCTAFQKFLFTPKNEIKGNHVHIDVHGNRFKNHPMPTTCEKYKEFDFMQD